MRAFASPDTVLSYHFGSYVEPSMHDLGLQQVKPYLAVLRGCRNVFYYTAWGDEGGIAPSLESYPCLRATAEATNRLKSGLADLLLGAQPEPPPIAIHWSRASYYFSFLVSGPHVAWQYNTLIAFLQQRGYPFTFVSTRQIEAGELGQYRVLLMPVSQCLGDAEAARIQAFVEQGGTVIADVRPGIADAHGNLRSGDRALPFLGQTWSALLTTEGKAPLIPLTRGDDKVGVDAQAVAGPGTTTETVGGHDRLLATCRLGRGWVVCLNTPFGDSLAPNLLERALQAHGPSSDFGLPAGGLPGFEGVRRRDRDAHYVGLTRSDTGGPAVPVTVDFGQTGYLYDLLAGTSLGRASSRVVELGPSATVLLALQPYQTAGLEVSLDRPACPAGDAIRGRVKVATGGPAPARHVIHLAVQRPDGVELPWLGCNLVTTDGEAPFAIWLPLNAPAGPWRLLLQDVASGVRQQIACVVNRTP